MPTPVSSTCEGTAETPEVPTRPGPKDSGIQLEARGFVCPPGSGLGLGLPRNKWLNAARVRSHSATRPASAQALTP